MSYSYDAVGNRTQKVSTLPGYPGGLTNYNANDQLTTDTYDSDGNTTASNGVGYVYDFENHLVQAGAGISMVYDGDGNRASKTVAGVTTNYLVDPFSPTGYAQVVYETFSGSTAGNREQTHTFSYGLELVNEARSYLVNYQSANSMIYFDYDGHGSVRALTDPNGNVTDTYDYDAFGNLIHSSTTLSSPTPNEFLFAGEQFDSDLGLYYNRARYLNVSSGRFWTMDSFEGDPEVPASLHKYLYVGDNAPNQIDPSGHFGLAEYMAAAAVVLALAAITYNHFFPTAEHFGLIWDADIDWSAPLHSPSNTPTGSFTSGEIQEIKNQALQSLKLAFAPFLVTVEEGRRGVHTVAVNNIRTVIRGVEADCHTDAEGFSRVSFCHYPSISDDAQHVVGSSDLPGLALATGRGIGNAAAHEIGHQFALYKMHDASDGFYEHDGATPAFFLQDHLQWTVVSQDQLKSKLGANQ